jgi:hypothetical protein
MSTRQRNNKRSRDQGATANKDYTNEPNEVEFKVFFLRLTVNSCFLVRHLFLSLVISAALNTILFQQNLKTMISAGGGMHLQPSLEISAPSFPAKRAYNKIKK